MGLAAIETERLTLRPFQDADVDPLYAMMSDGEAMKYTYVALSREDCEKRLRAYALSESEHGFAPWTVLLRSEEEIIGWGGLNVDPFDPGWGIEVSYLFAPAYWGRGYATELVHTSLQYGFEELSIPLIVAFARPQNIASVRVLEKCGFTFLRYEPRLERNHYTIQRPS